MESYAGHGPWIPLVLSLKARMSSTMLSALLFGKLSINFYSLALEAFQSKLLLQERENKLILQFIISWSDLFDLVILNHHCRKKLQ